MAQFRCGVLQLSVETGSFCNFVPDQRICHLCDTGIEDEFHFLCICPIYHNLKVIGSTLHKNCENIFFAYINTFANIKYCFIYVTSDMGATDHILKKYHEVKLKSRHCCLDE